jgi:hypothetical protein
MPIPAIIGGVVGATTLAGGMAALSAFEIIASVGAIAGAVGVVTKSKELTALGGIAALAGGVGAFAQNQGWLANAGAANTAASGAGGAEAVSNTTAAINAPTSGVAPVSGAVGETVTAGLPDGGSVVQDAISQGTDLAGAGDAGLMFAGQDANAAASLGQRSLMQAGGLDPATFGDAGMMYAGQDGKAATTLGGGPKTVKSGSVFDSLKRLFTDKDGNVDKTMASIAANFVGGAFDSKKKAETDLYKTRTEAEKAQMKNGNDVPNLGIGTKKTGPLFKPPGPTYYGPNVSGLMFAR